MSLPCIVRVKNETTPFQVCAENGSLRAYQITGVSKVARSIEKTMSAMDPFLHRVWPVRLAVM
ncbi:hypothetical protein GCM10019059_39830 [Camelimonas fluminis]|nr:hypothetical protein GCM10019059_39830 [Camelimonas fluminis]